MAEFIGQMLGPYRIIEQIGLGGRLLPTDVNSLLVAHDGALWVATSAGLGRYVSPQNQ